MTYAEKMDTVLQPRADVGPLVLDLFAGCGGLALGFEAQGFRTLGFEKEPDYCSTYRRNLAGDCIEIELTAESELPKADVVIGGPPCQPFSVGGYQTGKNDPRDCLPIFVAAIDRIRPDIWLFENVRGLLYRNRGYLDDAAETMRLMGYKVEVELIKAVEYGVPQRRERVFVVGHKGSFRFPSRTATYVTAGDALGELALQVPQDAKFLTASMDRYVEKYEKVSYCKKPRDLHLDEPSRTLTCRNIAAPTGDMMRVRLPDGRRRRLTAREAARLQSFPDWFEFVGSENSVFYQIGNAVPPLLAYQIAGCVRAYLNSGVRLSENALREASKEAQLVLFDPAP